MKKILLILNFILITISSLITCKEVNQNQQVINNQKNLIENFGFLISAQAPTCSINNNFNSTDPRKKTNINFSLTNNSNKNIVITFKDNKLKNNFLKYKSANPNSKYIYTDTQKQCVLIPPRGSFQAYLDSRTIELDYDLFNNIPPSWSDYANNNAHKPTKIILKPKSQDPNKSTFYLKFDQNKKLIPDNTICYDRSNNIDQNRILSETITLKPSRPELS